MSGAADFFKRVQAGIKQMEREIAATIVEVEAENFHEENFQKQGFTDVGFQPWAPRKNPDKNPLPRSLLVQTGVMKGHATKATNSGNKVIFKFPSDYMQVHNEGGRAGRGSGFTMPKRQFIGKSKLLETRIEKKVIEYMKRKLNNI